jgi:TolB-like protein
MKTLAAVAFILSFYFLSFTQIFAQNQSVPSIAVLPFSSNGIDSISAQTAESILILELTNRTKLNVISLTPNNDSLYYSGCMDSKCAAEIGKKIGAAKVLGCKLAALGNKIIVQYFLVDAMSGKEEILDQITSTTVEDLQTAMKRIAQSVADSIPASQDAAVGTVLKDESKTPLRRTARKNVGLSFGYLFPQNGYDNQGKVFVVDLHLDYEIQDYAVGMLFGIRQGFAMNIYGDYLFSQKDICPYLGGAFGFHWVSHSTSFEPIMSNSGSGTYYSNSNSNNRSDGFEITANTGLRILHTYNFQILLNLEFIYTLNDYNDSAIVFTIGIL